jgi:hypothetical protein
MAGAAGDDGGFAVGLGGAATDMRAERARRAVDVKGLGLNGLVACEAEGVSMSEGDAPEAKAIAHKC